MKQNLAETLIGFTVITVALLFFFYSYNGRKFNNLNNYSIIAKFQNVEGINVGSDVTLAGIKIGEVSSIILDNITFEAEVKIKINNQVKIPIDSRAAIVSSGLMGGKFVSITPGIEEQDMAENDAIKFTQSSLNLENLIGTFMYSGNNNSGQK